MSNIDRLKDAYVDSMIRCHQVASRSRVIPKIRAKLEAEADQIIDEHERQVAERAWDEGLRAGRSAPLVHLHPPTNPYRDKP